MTIEKPKGMFVPNWGLPMILSVLMAAFTSWGLISASRAETEQRLKSVEKDVEKKVDKELFNMVVEKLNSIEAKVDKLREER